MEQGDYYWAVDLPGLSRMDAESIIDLAQQRGFAAGVSTVDPSESMTLYLDRDTVTDLADILRSVGQPGQPKHPMLENFEHWLAYSDSKAPQN